MFGYGRLIRSSRNLARSESGAGKKQHGGAEGSVPNQRDQWVTPILLTSTKTEIRWDFELPRLMIR